MLIALVLVITFILIGLLADAVINLRKAQRSCERLVKVIEEATAKLNKE